MLPTGCSLLGATPPTRGFIFPAQVGDPFPGPKNTNMLVRAVTPSSGRSGLSIPPPSPSGNKRQIRLGNRSSRFLLLFAEQRPRCRGTASETNATAEAHRPRRPADCFPREEIPENRAEDRAKQTQEEYREEWCPRLLRFDRIGQSLVAVPAPADLDILRRQRAVAMRAILELPDRRRHVRRGRDGLDARRLWCRGRLFSLDSVRLGHRNDSELVRPPWNGHKAAFLAGRHSIYKRTTLLPNIGQA